MAKKKTEKKLEKKQTTQLKVIVTMMILLFVSIVALALVFDGMKTFEYGGLEFKKVAYGELQLYHARMPMADITGRVIANYNLYLRNDPRDLSYIPIEEDIELLGNTVISVDESIEKCKDNYRVIAQLAEFLASADIKAEFALTNKNLAKEQGLNYATCQESEFAELQIGEGGVDVHAKKRSILILREGNESSISRGAENCYVLSISSCENVKVVERFIVATIANSKGLEV
ncbi:MAG: hypothetical protein ABIE22_01760 [archaeon]